jgi:hypothetical protein
MSEFNEIIRMAICGLGSAGQSRMKAIEQFELVECAGVISRRSKIGTVTFEAAMADPTIDAIAISTENTDHGDRVHQCLEANKHVLCDYPLAFHAKQARELYALAKEKNKILHVEHISLLSTAHQKAQLEISSIGALKSGYYMFQAGCNEKLFDEDHWGPLPFLCLPRLLQLADLFGPLTIQSGEVVINKPCIEIKLKLEFSEGGILEFTERREPDLPRQRQLEVICEHSSYNWEAQPEQENLFLQDLSYFYERIHSDAECYYDEDMMVALIENLEKQASLLVTSY